MGVTMTSPNKCPRCGFTHQCICQRIPTLDSNTHIALLTHPKETTRSTNTGQFLAKSLPHCSVHQWDRVTAPQSLITLINRPDIEAYLLFPDADSESVHTRIAANSNRSTPSKTPLFIIIDSTWQEAKKIVRKSAWLAPLPHLHITPNKTSNYTLRRNQEDGHLCTLEVGCELMYTMGELVQAKQLSDFFLHYMKVYQADKSGHQLKPE